MTAHERTRALRRYLLGAATEDQYTAVEREYFDRDASLYEVSDVEDDLIADYLDERLTADERNRFERHYLASPIHRMRVAVTRALRRNAPETPQRSIAFVSRWVPRPAQAAAAAALLILGLAVWRGNVRFTTTPPAAPQTEARRPAPEPARPLPQRQPVVVALTIAPLNVRAAGDAATLTLPADAEIVELQLQGEVGERPVEGGRAIVRTVAGRDVWHGAAMPASAGGSEVLARLEIPAVHLSPDDYVVQLLESDASGREVERNRYFFRVRQR